MKKPKILLNILGWCLFFSVVFMISSCSRSISDFTVTTVHTGMTGSMRGIHVVSDQVIWISGSGGEFARSIDGGRSWLKDVVPDASKLDFRDVFGFSADTALLMSIGPGENSRVYRTLDGGNSWFMTYLNLDSLGFFDGMDFFDNHHGMIIGDPVDSKPYLLETKDGGVTWTRMDTSGMPDLFPGEYAFAASGTSLDLLPDGQGWLATGGSVARIFYSADYGLSWRVMSSPILQGNPAAGHFGISAHETGIVVAVGGNYQEMTLTGSNVVLSVDLEHWRVPEGSDEVPFMECVIWVDHRTLIAAGPPGLWYSQDTGENWSAVSEMGGHAMDMHHRTRTAWLVGGQGVVIKITW